MAKNKEQKSESKEKRVKGKHSVVEFFSFWGLTIAAVLFVVTAVMNVVNVENFASVISVLDLIAKVALLVAVGVPAYGYVRKKSSAWKLIFIIALVIYALGVVFSVI